MPAIALLFVAALAMEAPREGPGPRPGGGLFISPAGKPFRGGPEAADPREQWWREADRNRDGALDRAEVVADAAAFFVALDVNRDGVLDSAEVTRYEREIAPEILRRDPVPTGEARRAAGGRIRASRPPGGPTGVPMEGAARFGLLNDPQPIMSADFDLNRRVTAEEFQRKARDLFGELDRNRDGKILREELPGPRRGPPPPPPPR